MYKIFVLIAIIILSLTAPAYAVTDPFEVNIIAPTQVIPGTVMKIRVSLINTQEISSPQVQSENIAEQTRNLNNIIVEEKKVTINDISYENPFQLIEDENTFQQFSIPKSTITENNEYSRRLFRNKTITQISISKPKTETEIVNKELTPVGSALKLRNELQNEFSNRIKTETLSPEQIKSYVELEKKLNKIIQDGRNSIILEVPVPEEFPEGVTLKIPIDITYSTESSSPKTFSATTTVTVTSNPIPKRAIIIDIDGAKRDALYNSLSSMQNTSLIVGDGVKFTNAKTVFPSITLAAQASIFTGNYPGRHNIAGNTWFEKSSLTYRKYGEDVWYEDIIWSEGRANEDLSAGVDTIYESAKSGRNIDSTVIFNHYSRLESDTTKWIIPGAEEGWYNEVTHEYEKVDSNAMSRTLEELTYYAPPGILTIYLPGLDGYGHYYGPNRADPYNQEYYFKNYIDEQIGRLLNGDCVDYSITGDCTVYFDGLVGSGLKDETIIVVVSDHGQTNVIDDDAHAISKDKLEAILKNAGYDINDLPLEPDYDAVAAPNGGMAQIYIRDIDTKDWNDQPELSDLRSALDAFYSQAYVDIILVKYSGSVGYRVYAGSGNTQDLETFFTDRPNYVDAIKRIKGLDAARSGDIILLADYGEGYYYEDKLEAGTHGSLNQEDAYIPLVFSGPTIRKGETDPSPASNIDIAPTIANLLGFSMPEADGIPLDIKNRPPNTPSTPTGPTSGHASTTYSYSTSATDPDGDAIKYLFDWGDGTTTETAHYSSGTTASASHSWSSPGTYNVKVKAIDGSDATSDWSSSLSVSITGACSTSSDALANAIVGDKIALTSTAFDGNCRAARIFNSPVGFLSATEGDTFLILSSGRAANIPGNPADFRSTDFLPEGASGDTASLALNFVVPGSATKLKFDFRFMSEEYPEYVGSEFNDFFNAYLTDSTGTHQIAFDTNGNIINVNNNFFDPAIYPAGTVFNGATPKLTTTADVTPGDSISMKFEVGDVGDGVFDTAVFIDNVRFESEGGGGTSAKADVRVTKHGPTNVEKGKQMTYTINYYNIEEGKANNVVVTDILPGQASFVSAPGGTYNPAMHSVSWNLGTLQKFSSGSLSLTISVPDSVVTGTILSNSVSISTTSEESNTQNNNREWSTTITDRATLPPNVKVEPITTNYNGAPKVYWDNPITFTYHGDSTACGVSININLDDGGSDVSGPMTRTLSTNEWTFTYTFYPRYGSGTVTYTVTHCDGTAITTNHDILVDPSGWVENKFTGERIEGVTVTLKRFDATLQQFAFVNPSDLGIDPHINPQTTDKNGGFGWMVSPGIYRVEVEKAGYFSTYSDVSVPPEVTDLAIKLEPMDIIPPTTTALLSGSLGNNGWYNSDVQVTLTATDNIGGSGVNKIEYSFDDVIWIKYTAPFNISNEGIKTVYYRSTDNASNVESTKTQTISIDRTPPTITGAATTSPNTKGWYNADVVVHFIASDEVSGIDTVTPDQTLSIEGALQSVTGEATDKAGNFASTTVSDINIDKTPPGISISGVSDGSYYNIDVTPVITISDTNLDAQSITLNGASYASGTVVSAEGSYTLVASANDMAGNSMTKTVNFVIDKTAPEAAIRFNVISKDIKVYDSETGEEAGYAALPSKNKGDEKGWELRQYTLRDSADNTLLLVLKYKKEKKQAEISVISAQYNGGAVIGEVNNKILVRYVEGSSLKELEQKIEAKKLFAIEAKYKAGKGETEIRTHLEGRKEKKETRAGIAILELLTNNGGFIPRY